MTIPTVEWVKEYRLKNERFQHLYKDFLKTKTTELINKYIVDPIVRIMELNGVSRKIYENVEVKNVIVNSAGIKATIHNEYFSEEGFDVALAREEGTEDHMIRPRTKQALSWIQDGRRRFSGGHMVSGLPRLKIVPRMIERGEYEVQEKLNLAFKEWKQQVFQ